jgi:hypothetical protein
VYTRPENTTSPAMATTVSATATSGSHQAVAPSAMRPGIANGAVAGNKDTSRDQPLSGSPLTAMNEAQYAPIIK